MWRLTKQLSGKCVHVNKKVLFAGMEAIVTDLWHSEGQASSGLVGPATKVVFRSLTAEVHILLQMSAEMW